MMRNIAFKNFFTKKRILKIVFLMLLLGAVGFAFTIRYPKMTGIRKTEVKRLEGKTMYVQVEVEIYNANFFAVHLQSFENEITINDTKVAISKKQDKAVLKARCHTIVNVEVALNVQAMAKIYPLLKKQDVCQVDIKGKYAIGTWLSTFRVNGNDHQQLKLDKDQDEILKFALGKEGLKATNLKTSASVTGMDISINLGLKNNYPFDYKINTLDVDITPSDNNSKLGHWKLPQQKIIHANTLESFPVTFHIDSNKLMHALSIMYTKKVKAVGGCQVVIADEVFDIPFKQVIDLPAQQMITTQF